MAQQYDDTSIDLLKGATRIRKRPASMLGSSGLAGARHGFTEIYGNALDEKTPKLIVRYYKDKSISVRDYGRGVPLGWNNKAGVKNWNWHIIYNELYGGGKYDNHQKELQAITDWGSFDPNLYNYLFSVGLNGLGAASTQYTSEFFEVESYRDGVCKSRRFERGLPLVDGVPFDMFIASQEDIEAIPEEIRETDEENGTYIRWKPDDTVFDEVEVGSDWLFETCQDVASVSGVELHFIDDNTGKDITIPAGELPDVITSHSGRALITDESDNPVLFSTSSFDHGYTRVEGEDFLWICKCEVAFGLTTSEVPHSCYHNSVKMVSGVQYDAITAAIANFMQERGRERGVKVDKRDFSHVFNVAVSTYSNYASFRNQTKDAVDDLFIYSLVKETFDKKLRLEYGKGNKYLQAVIDSVVEEAQTRIEAQQLQDIAKKANKVKKEKTPDKLVSCEAYENKDWEDVEIWIVEGDSAANSVKEARDRRFQAIYPIRGKGLNVLKASNARILENKEIRELFSILGTGFDLHIKGAKFFNMDDLRVGKIIIATDADEDGYQIRVLIFLELYKLAPQLIEAGKVFIAETPRFGIYLSDGTRVFARDNNERDKLVAENAGRITRISRYKGLGEVDPVILRETTVCPETRRLIPVTCDFKNETERELIDALFGADKYKQRKDIISAVLGAEVTDMLTDNALLIGEIDEAEYEDGIEYEEVEV